MTCCLPVAPRGRRQGLTRQAYRSFLHRFAHDVDRDGAIFKRIAQNDDYSGSTITVQEIDADGNAISGAVKVFTGCVVKSATAPDGDANSQDASVLTVVFTVGGVA